MPSHRFWTNWLLVASLLLAVQGITWVVLGSFDPFGIYDKMLAHALLNVDALPADAEKIFHFVVTLLGATDAAFFVLFAFIVRYPFARRERWSHVALSTAILLWFVVDSASSLYFGAVFNVTIVNLPCLLILGIPLVGSARAFYSETVNL